MNIAGFFPVGYYSRHMTYSYNSYHHDRHFTCRKCKILLQSSHRYSRTSLVRPYTLAIKMWSLKTGVVHVYDGIYYTAGVIHIAQSEQ